MSELPPSSSPLPDPYLDRPSWPQALLTTGVSALLVWFLWWLLFVVAAIVVAFGSWDELRSVDDATDVAELGFRVVLAAIVPSLIVIPVEALLIKALLPVFTSWRITFGGALLVSLVAWVGLIAGVMVDLVVGLLSLGLISLAGHIAAGAWMLRQRTLPKTA